MHEYRIHGRGGQGVMTVGQLVAHAYFRYGRFVQAFATYGGERRGAPVTAFVRVTDHPISRRCDVEHPDLVMLFEPTFLQDGSGLAGLKPGATLIINTVKSPADFTDLGPYRIATIDALGIARECGLNRIINTAMLGAFCRMTGHLSLDQIEAVVREKVPAKTEANVRALRLAYDSVRTAEEVAHHG
jgi:2-oxoacid:acceptor oxidoreductase gamma subunit (pyruvate/2-ketoisovalerate family)